LYCRKKIYMPLERPLKICAVTGSRADWGLLAVLLAELRDDPHFDLAIIATGQHLLTSAGNTASVIEAEGFEIAERVEILLASDTPAAVSKSMALAVSGIADALARRAPDLMLVLGDRYEILAAVQAALVAQIPVAHLCGGDITEGAIDDAIRHAITKMSHLHFVSNVDAARRVRQMGEELRNIHCVGSPGLDLIRLTPEVEREDFFHQIDFTPRPRNLLVTVHPVTLDVDSTAQAKSVLTALERLNSDFGIILTGTNSDVGSSGIDQCLSEFVRSRENAKLYQSLGSSLYFGALKHVDAVVGNSSSGLYEAPSFGTPTVNVGDRQNGRVRAASVIDCAADPDAILNAIERALRLDCSSVKNPYGDGDAAEKILSVLKELRDPQALLRKKFSALEMSSG
jgi:UDP-hydrolysing UDP-N-acetyl-D-glucosamine 2-epimerase